MQKSPALPAESVPEPDKVEMAKHDLLEAYLQKTDKPSLGSPQKDKIRDEILRKGNVRLRLLALDIDSPTYEYCLEPHAFSNIPNNIGAPYTFEFPITGFTMDMVREQLRAVLIQEAFRQEKDWLEKLSKSGCAELARQKMTKLMRWQRKALAELSDNAKPTYTTT